MERPLACVVSRMTRFTKCPMLVVAALLALTAATPARAATPPKGAFFYVGNVDDGSRSGVVDRRNAGGNAKSFNTALDDGDDMAVGDVLGDSFDELLVADDGKG